MTTSTGILICCLSIAASPGDSWSGFRGTGDSVSLAESVPVEWSDDTVAWRQPLKGYGQSSPIVFGGRVIVTSMAGDNKETAVISFFDLKDGELLRVQEIPSSQQVKASGMVSRGAPTPCCDAERVYLLFESGDLLATDHVGEILWKRSLVREYGEIQGNHGISSSLAQNSDRIFVLMNHGGPSYLMACNKTNGETVWKTDYEKRVSWNSPVVSRPGDSSSDLIVVSGGGRIDAYDATNGVTAWFLDGVDGNTVPSATVAESQVWIGSSKVGQNFGIPLKGVGDRSPEIPFAVCDKATCTFSSPLYHRGNVYCVSRAGWRSAMMRLTENCTGKSELRPVVGRHTSASASTSISFQKTEPRPSSRRKKN